MPIVSSTVIVDDHTQTSGARYVREVHLDQDGIQYDVGPYLAQPGYDYTARMQSRVAEIDEQLAQAEVNEELASVAA